MTGSNCCIPKCTNSRTRHPGVALFRIPTKDGEYSAVWRKNILDVVTKYREVDSRFKTQIQNKTVHICEEHYAKDKLIRRKYCCTSIILHSSGDKNISALP